mmetsp:Transcript_1740/g.2503  ORF Transcript_1740/g.2503 Transcript_1740/m.2503 type:complete len:206 (-) Transcript_1740:141-758(-)
MNKEVIPFLLIVFGMCISLVHSFSTNLPVYQIKPASRGKLPETTFSTDNYNQRHVATKSLNMFPESSSIMDQSTSLLLAETEGWRQYVLLVVSLGVILDILLGSPLANLALGPMRRAAMEKQDNPNAGNNNDNDSMLSGSKPTFVRNPKERVDSDAVAQAALDKARNSMELRRFLEENKTDEQRYEEIRKKIDAEAAKFDSKMES